MVAVPTQCPWCNGTGVERQYDLDGDPPYEVIDEYPCGMCNATGKFNPRELPRKLPKLPLKLPKFAGTRQARCGRNPRSLALREGTAAARLPDVPKVHFPPGAVHLQGLPRAA